LSIRTTIRFQRRGRTIALDAPAALGLVLDHLRIAERATGTKEGCAEGDCGACTVVLARRRDGRIVYEPVNACILMAGQLDGAEVFTVEDLATEGRLHPVQTAMADGHGAQCGFCTPGIVMSLFALDRRCEAPPTRDDVTTALAGNLCRCTGYRPIIDAALAQCGRAGEAGPQADLDALARLDDGADVFCGDDTAFFAAPAREDTIADLVARYPQAWLLAGGTDLGLTITKGLASPRQVIHVGRVRALEDITREGDVLVLGAGVTHARAFAALADLDPDLGEILRRFGSPQVRATGTVGGNIANGSPIGDLAPCLLALGAEVELGSTTGPRRVPLERFFLGYKSQDRRPGEYVRALRVAVPTANSRFRAFKVSKRLDEDITAVLVAVHLRLDDDRIGEARIGCGGVAAIPSRAPLAEAALTGVRLSDRAAWTPALDALAAEFTPLSDHRASASYRRALLRNLLLKALLEIAGASPADTRIRPSREAADV
jgi:xanthine dehydrogenase small subunit